MDRFSVSGPEVRPERGSLEKPAFIIGWRDALSLTKPGINLSNTWACFVGYWLATGGAPDPKQLALTLLGMLLVVGGSCALNNGIDLDLDRFMERTKDRPVPAGRISRETAGMLGGLLTVGGVVLLHITAAPLAAWLAIAGSFLYVVVYTLWLKRVSSINTVVGSLSGAIPPLVGWAAAGASLDLSAWILFAILFLWQPPHFFALAMLKAEDYRKAGVPMLPVVKGAKATQKQILLFVTLLVPASLLPVMRGEAGMAYAAITGLLNTGYLACALRGPMHGAGKDWARGMFRYSLVYLTVVLTALAAFSPLSVPI